MKFNLFKPKKRRSSPSKKVTRQVKKLVFIDKILLKDMVKGIVLGQIANTGSAIGFVFDEDSIVTNAGQLVGAQSTALPIKGATVIFYIECLFKQFELEQKSNLSPSHENLQKLNDFLKRIVADQIFAIESRPENNAN